MSQTSKSGVEFERCHH